MNSTVICFSFVLFFTSTHLNSSKFDKTSTADMEITFDCAFVQVENEKNAEELCSVLLPTLNIYE